MIIKNSFLPLNSLKFARNAFIKVILPCILFLVSLNLSAQNNYINILEENITINKDSSFTKNVSIILKESINIITYPVFYDRELEEISDLRVYQKKGNRFKIVKDPYIEEDEIDIDYITSRKVKSVSLPPGAEAKITYNVKCSELMYFSNLYFFSYDSIDTLKYHINIPETFCFSHDIIYKDSLKYLAIDSLKTDSITRWNIEVVPAKVEPNHLMYFGIYRNLKVPLMRTIVVPAAYKNKEKEYMNDWYLKNVSSRRGLDTAAIQKIEELTIGIDDPGKVMDTIYNYVRTNFKYVAIEIGMGAFVPSHVNEVFLNKQGDCKDLSNFLSEALNYKGIKSNVALAATYNHISDCDFPSLGSANHVVCVTYMNGKPIILDPTDPIHIPETPVQSIQERSILIIEPSGGEFYKVNGFPPQQNEINYEIALKAYPDRKLMEGNFKAVYKGISGNYLRREFMDVSSDSKNSNQNEHYESVFGNQSVDDLHIHNHAKTIEVEGLLSVNGKIFDDSDNRFLFIDFLPRLIETEDRETLLEGTHLGSTIYKNVMLKITLDKSFEAFDPVEYNFSNEGISLKMKITNSSDLNIECNYEFFLDHIFIDNENLDIINEIIESFNKISNEPVILKNKS